MNKTIIVIVLCCVIFTVGLGVHVLADNEFEQKLKIVDEKLKQKVDKMTIGQIRALIIEYHYCVYWEDYLISIDFPITYVDKVSCLNHIEEFLDLI